MELVLGFARRAAYVTGRIQQVRGNLDAALPKASKVARSSIMRPSEWKEIGAFMRRLRSLSGHGCQGSRVCDPDGCSIRRSAAEQPGLKSILQRHCGRAGRSYEVRPRATRVPLSKGSIKMLRCAPRAAVLSILCFRNARTAFPHEPYGKYFADGRRGDGTRISQLVS